MKSKFYVCLLSMVFCCVFFTENATSLTLDYYTGLASHSTYSETGSELFHLSNLSDPTTDWFQINSTILDEYQHDYRIGIFAWDGSSITSSLNVIDTFLSVTTSDVVFNLTDGTATSTGLGETVVMDTTFGFYIEFYLDIGSGILQDEIYYSVESLNIDQSTITPNPFHSFYDPQGIAISGEIAELVLGVGGPTTPGYALLAINNVSPIPEPATIFLFGLGIVAIANAKRRVKPK